MPFPVNNHFLHIVTNTAIRRPAVTRERLLTAPTTGSTSMTLAVVILLGLPFSADDFIMGIPFHFSKKYESSKTDGLVSNESSEFALYKGDCLDESISHSEIVGFSLSKKKRKRIEEFYINLCNELSGLGY
jgi:hypothetical protein